MARKTKQASQTRDDSESDPESDLEKRNRDDERGRTVLALVGKAIQSNTKISLQWNSRKVPYGDHKDNFSTYIGVVVRERVCINYKNWNDVPKQKKDEVYEFIAKEFMVRQDRRKWILTRASKRWNAFKTRLRKIWLYKSKGKIRKKSPWKYPWVDEPSWHKFIETYTTPEFRKISAKFREKSLLKKSSYRGGRLGYQYFEEQLETELLSKGISFSEIPRHLVWLKAHCIEEDGNLITFTNPADLEVVEAIKTLMAQSKDGGMGSKGRDDILSKALNKPEQGGRVVAVGSGITNTEYFGYNKPIPPTQLHTQMYGLMSEVGAMKAQHNLLTSFVVSILNEDQLKRFTALCNGAQSSGLIGQVGTQFTDFDGRIGGDSGQIGSNGAQSNTLLEQGVSFTQLLTGNYALREPINKGVNISVNTDKGGDQREDLEPYRVPWPETESLRYNNTYDVQQHSNNSFIFPEGESDCCLAINDHQGNQIVAIGTMFIEDATKATVHFHSLSTDVRRVSISEVLVPTALLPCPTEEWTVVIQAKHSFVKWPSHLIFPRDMVGTEKANMNHQPENQLATTSPRPCSSHGSCTLKYIITPKDRAKLTTDLVRVAKNEAMTMKKNDNKIIVPIPNSVSGFPFDVQLNYEDVLDWCFQRAIGASHITIFMKYLSEKCHKESVSGIYGFCDVNFLSLLSPMEKQERIDYLARIFGCNEGLNINQTFFAPFHENRHWMLAVVSPWNGMVWWLDPAGSENPTSTFAQDIINGEIIKFSLEHRKDIKKIKKNPHIKWRKPSCPRQSLDSLDCGFYVCRYMLETIANRLPGIPDQYFKDVPKAYCQQMIDEVRESWITFVLKHKAVEEEEDENDMEVV